MSNGWGLARGPVDIRLGKAAIIDQYLPRKKAWPKDAFGSIAQFIIAIRFITSRDDCVECDWIEVSNTKWWWIPNPIEESNRRSKITPTVSCPLAIVSARFLANCSPQRDTTSSARMQITWNFRTPSVWDNRTQKAFTSRLVCISISSRAHEQTEQVLHHRSGIVRRYKKEFAGLVFLRKFMNRPLAKESRFASELWRGRSSSGSVFAICCQFRRRGEVWQRCRWDQMWRHGLLSRNRFACGMSRSHAAAYLFLSWSTFGCELSVLSGWRWEISNNIMDRESPLKLLLIPRKSLNEILKTFGRLIRRCRASMSQVLHANKHDFA